MGFVFCIAPCVSCGAPLSFNPNLVPSVRVQGEKRPVCRTCIENANNIRKTKGLELLVILPGAYGSCPEEELHSVEMGS